MLVEPSTRTGYHLVMPIGKSFVRRDDNKMESHRETPARKAFSLAEIAESTGLSQGYLRNEIRAKRLPIRKFGRRVVVLASDLQRFLDEGSPREVSSDAG